MTARSHSDSRPKSALLMKPYWADQIIHHGKNIELRSFCIVKKGRIALACGGLLVGEVTIKNCFLLLQQDPDGQMRQLGTTAFTDLKSQHRVEDSDVETLQVLSKYKKVWAWELEDPIAYTPPQGYFHPRGAIRWVDLTKPPGQRRRKNQDKRVA